MSAALLECTPGEGKVAKLLSRVTEHNQGLQFSKACTYASYAVLSEGFNRAAKICLRRGRKIVRKIGWGHQRHSVFWTLTETAAAHRLNQMAAVGEGDVDTGSHT